MTQLMNEEKEGAHPGVVATIGRFCCHASDGNIYDLRAGAHRVRACRPPIRDHENRSAHTGGVN
jgi:hypothetical protein